jgi:hypothetical protein
MKIIFAISSLISFSLNLAAQTNADAAVILKATGKNLYIDVHHLPPGKVNYKDVAAAHAKDLAVEKKYGVEFISYWVNKKEGLIYCLSSSSDTESIKRTHAEAHGLMPDHIFKVTSGTKAASKNKKNFFLDVHQFGAGKVSAKDVAAAHKKDLAIQKKYGVNFINYWVDEKEGVVMCLSEAKDSNSIIKTHKEAHGLIPVSVIKVNQGQ